MQILKISSIVGAVHFGLFVILVQPGCQSIDRAWEEHRAERGTVLAKEPDLLPAAEPLPAPQSELNQVTLPETDLVGAQARFRPTRPPREPEPVRPITDEFINAGVNDFQIEPAAPPSSSESGIGQGGGASYTVRPGDSLWAIAQRNGIPFNALLEANGMTRETRLRVGQSLVLPAGYASAANSTPSGTGPAMAVEGWGSYTVQSGDSLSRIASRTGTTVSELQRVNGLSGSTIFAGQELQVPGGGSALGSRSGTASIAESAPAGSLDGTHEVQPGEYPQAIARMYGMSTTELLRVNNITDPTRMRVGQVLKVRSTSGVDRAPTAVRSGGSKLNAAGMDDGSVIVEPTTTASGEEGNEGIPTFMGEDGVIEVDIPEVSMNREGESVAPLVVPDADGLEVEPIPDDEIGFDEDEFEDIPTVEIERN